MSVASFAVQQIERDATGVIDLHHVTGCPDHILGVHRAGVVSGDHHADRIQRFDGDCRRFDLEPGGRCEADAALDLPIAGRTELDRDVSLPAEKCTSSGEN